jgi:hypothetical protein
LGVRSDASHDDIKRAYLDLALKHHPDRQAEAGDAAGRDAAFRMQEINAAWEVLRSPGRRAAYDSELRGVRPVWESGARSRSPRTAPVRMGGDARGTSAPSPPGFEVAAPVAPFLRFGPIIVVLVILGAILVFTAYATSQDSNDEGGVEVATGAPFPDGSCVQLASVGGRVVPQKVTNCGSRGAFEVVETVDLGRPCPGGTEGFDFASEKMRLCLVEAGP